METEKKAFSSKLYHFCDWNSSNGDLPLSSVSSRELLQRSLVKTFPKQIYFFLFSFSRGIQLFKLIETTSYFSKTNIFTSKAPLVLIFFQGLQNLLRPVNQMRKLPIILIYLANVVEVIVFWASQSFSVECGVRLIFLKCCCENLSFPQPSVGWIKMKVYTPTNFPNPGQ